MFFVSGLFFIVSLTVVVIFLVFKGHIVVHEGEVVVLERLGRFSTILTPGLNIIAPFINSPKFVHWERLVEEKDDTNERTIHRDVFKGCRIKTSNIAFDIPPVMCFTKERVEIEVNIVVYYDIVDVKKAVYNTQNLYGVIETKIETLLVNMINDLSIDNITTQSLYVEMNRNVSSESFLKDFGLKLRELLVQNVSIPRELAISTIDSVTMKRQMESKQMALKAEEENTLAKLLMNEKIAAIQRQAELTKEKHRLSLLDIQTHHDLERIRKTIERENETVQSQSLIRLKEEEERLKIVKESGLPMDYFYEKERREQLTALMNSQSKNKTLIIPYEAITSSTTGRQIVFKHLNPNSDTTLTTIV
jgi:regulator of protease activity HflC (stomatin/prohibitin superfamily)